MVFLSIISLLTLPSLSFAKYHVPRNSFGISNSPSSPGTPFVDLEFFTSPLALLEVEFPTFLFERKSSKLSLFFVLLNVSVFQSSSPDITKVLPVSLAVKALFTSLSLSLII